MTAPLFNPPQPELALRAGKITGMPEGIAAREVFPMGKRNLAVRIIAIIMCALLVLSIVVVGITALR